MSHLLYRNTMAFTGQQPWHKLGVHFDQDFTSAEAIAAARLDYPVTKEQLFRIRARVPSRGVRVPARPVP